MITFKGKAYFTCRPNHGVFTKKSQLRQLSDNNNNVQATTIDNTKLQSLKVGNKVKIKTKGDGLIKFIGTTHFSNGKTVYGIELNSAVGTGDGSKDGKQYFLCKPQHGIFCQQTHIESVYDQSQNSSAFTDLNLKVASKIVLKNDKGYGTVRYIGPAHFLRPGEICYGIELSEPNGNHDGMVKGQRYFECKENYGIMCKKDQIDKIVTTVDMDIHKKSVKNTNFFLRHKNKKKNNFDFEQTDRFHHIESPNVNVDVKLQDRKNLLLDKQNSGVSTRNRVDSFTNVSRKHLVEHGAERIRNLQKKSSSRSPRLHKTNPRKLSPESKQWPPKKLNANKKGCLHESTQLWIENESKIIRCEKISSVKVGDRVLGFNFETNSVEFSRVIDKLSSNCQTVIVVKTATSDFSLTCTSNHKLYVSNIHS